MHHHESFCKVVSSAKEQSFISISHHASISSGADSALLEIEWIYGGSDNVMSRPDYQRLPGHRH